MNAETMIPAPLCGKCGGPTLRNNYGFPGICLECSTLYREPEACSLRQCIMDGNKMLGIVGVNLTLAAHHAGDGWWIGAENENGGVACHLDWPADWPEKVNSEWLRSRGFKIV